MIGGIDAAAGIFVVQPDTARRTIFLDDEIGDIRQAQGLRHGNAADARTDNDDWFLGWCGDGFSARAGKAHLLAHHGRIFRRHGLAKACAHHAHEQGVIRIADGGPGLSV